MTHFVGTLPEFSLLDVCKAAFPVPFGLIDALQELLSLDILVATSQAIRK